MHVSELASSDLVDLLIGEDHVHDFRRITFHQDRPDVMAVYYELSMQTSGGQGQITVEF